MSQIKFEDLSSANIYLNIFKLLFSLEDGTINSYW